MTIRLISLFFPITCTAHLCYSCYGETTNSPCFYNARSAGWVDCEKGECQVWSLFSSDSSTDIYMFERSCSGICEPGCVEISDMGHRFTSCTTCCSSNFCNIGSSSSLIFFSLTFFFSIVSLCLLLF